MGCSIPNLDIGKKLSARVETPALKTEHMGSEIFVTFGAEKRGGGVLTFVGSRRAEPREAFASSSADPLPEREVDSSLPNLCSKTAFFGKIRQRAGQSVFSLGSVPGP